MSVGCDRNYGGTGSRTGRRQLIARGSGITTCARICPSVSASCAGIHHCGDMTGVAAGMVGVWLSETYRVCQRAGNLVKEYRGTLPPRYAPSDTDEDRRAKADLKCSGARCSNRDSTDRLAGADDRAHGKYATHYISWSSTSICRALPMCARRCGAWSAIERKGGIYHILAIEGNRTGAQVTSTSSRTTAPRRREVRFLWQCGEVTDWPVFAGYRQGARLSLPARPSSPRSAATESSSRWGGIRGAARAVCARSCRRRRCGSTSDVRSRCSSDAMFPRVRTGGMSIWQLPVAS